MSPHQLFSIVNPGILPFWLLLALFPRWRYTQTIVAFAVPVLLALLYLYLLFRTFTGEGAAGDFNSLDGVAKLFSSPTALLAGWVHYLAFDLFIGAWQVRDAQARGIRHWLVVPCLFLTLMYGPVGLLLYFCLRRSIHF